MLKDRRLPRLSFRECRADNGFKDEQNCEPEEAKRYILRFDIAGGDPKNVALYCGGQPVAFVNRCGYALGEGLYINGVIYLERDGEGYCFVSSKLPSEENSYSVYECTPSKGWFDMFRVEISLIGEPDRGQIRIRRRNRQKISIIKGGYMQ